MEATVESWGMHMSESKKYCPYCNYNSVEYLYSIGEIKYCPPIYKKWIGYAPEENTSTSYYICLNCKSVFDVDRTKW